jgi:hypothetical protein
MGQRTKRELHVSQVNQEELFNQKRLPVSYLNQAKLQVSQINQDTLQGGEPIIKTSFRLINSVKESFS